MAGQPRYTAMDVPYLLELDTTANDTVRVCMPQRRPAREHDRYEDDEEMTPPHYGQSRRGKNLRHVGRGLASQDRDIYPSLEQQYNDLGPAEHGRRGRRYPSPPPYDAADEELEFDRRGRRRNRGPTSYDEADDGFIFDDELHGDFSRHRLRSDRLPFPARDMGMGHFDQCSYLDTNLNPRSLHAPRGLRGSRDMDVDYLSGLRPQVRRGMEPRLNNYDSFPDNYDDYFDMGRRLDRRDLGRAGRYRTEYCFQDDFDDDHLQDSIYEARHRLRNRLRGYHPSDLSIQSVFDDYRDEFTGEIRAPTAAEIIHRAFLIEMHHEFDAGDRERERQEAEDFEVHDIGRDLPDRRGRMPRVAGPRPADIWDGDVEFHRVRRGDPSQPHQAGNRQSPPQDPRANDKVDRSRGRNQQAPPSYDSVTPAQVAARVQAELANDANHPAVAAAVAYATAEEVPRDQQHAPGRVAHAKIRGAPRHGAGAINNPNNLSAAPRETSIDRARPSPAEVGDHGRCSDSSDSGADTPDDGSETSRAGDDNSEGGAFLQSAIHITL